MKKLNCASRRVMVVKIVSAVTDVFLPKDLVANILSCIFSLASVS